MFKFGASIGRVYTFCKLVLVLYACLSSLIHVWTERWFLLFNHPFLKIISIFLRNKVPHSKQDCRIVVIDYSLRLLHIGEEDNLNKRKCMHAILTYKTMEGKSKHISIVPTQEGIQREVDRPKKQDHKNFSQSATPRTRLKKRDKRTHIATALLIIPRAMSLCSLARLKSQENIVYTGSPRGSRNNGGEVDIRNVDESI